MKSLKQLVDGSKVFKQQLFGADSPSSNRPGVSKQNATVLMIACSDSRVDPAIVLGAELEDLFIIRNVANLVPPFKESSANDGVGAALEYAVCHLDIADIVVCGHTHCAGIRAVMTQNEDPAQTDGTLVDSWVRVAADARSRVKAEHSHLSDEKQLRCCEQESVLVGLENLMTFPWIHERVRAGNLRLHAWHFDIATGNLSGWNPDSKSFHPLN